MNVCAIVSVSWLAAVATGPLAYGVVQGAIAPLVGRVVLFGDTFAFVLHLCSGIRHLVWDSLDGFEFGSIYAVRLAVVTASQALTVAAWITSLLMAG